MHGYVADIEKLTLENTDFRRVLYTGRSIQLVLMTLRPGEEIGEEVHPDRDQFFRLERGQGAALIGGERSEVADDVVIVPAGAQHNVVNTGGGTVHGTKAEAEADDEEFDGGTSE